MLKTVVIDDEQDAVEFLCGALQMYCPEAVVVGSATNISDGHKEISTKMPDLVLLDIAMPSGNGFELLNLLPDRSFEVIFVTAYNEYAIKAFRYSAIDYLLKPVDISELIQAVRKIRSSPVNSVLPGLNNINVLLDNLSCGSPKKISLPTAKGFEYIFIDDIVRIEAQRSYCCFYLVNKKKYLVSRCLNDYQQLLEERRFFRIHNSHLINLKHVKSFTRSDGGFVEMADSSQVPVSRIKKDFFLVAMKAEIL
jgi:two-component system, LytTR family, response regulator